MRRLHRGSGPGSGPAARQSAATTLWVSSLAVRILALGMLGMVGSCGDPFENVATPPLQVAALSLGRWQLDPQLYQLTLTIHNGSEATLTGFTVSGIAHLAVEEDSTTGDSAEQRCPVNLHFSGSTAPGGSATRDLAFRLPLPFIPPGPVTLRQITIHDFTFTDPDHSLPGQITYPYSVEEQ